MCGSGAELVNGVEYYGSHIAVLGISLLAGAAVSVFSPNHSTHTAHAVHENCTKNLHKIYRCTNPKCKCEWIDY